MEGGGGKSSGVVSLVDGGDGRLRGSIERHDQLAFDEAFAHLGVGVHWLRIGLGLKGFNFDFGCEWTSILSWFGKMTEGGDVDVDVDVVSGRTSYLTTHHSPLTYIDPLGFFSSPIVVILKICKQQQPLCRSHVRKLVKDGVSDQARSGGESDGENWIQRAGDTSESEISR
ncbi:hypothetical protein Ccrd_019298 [Cynara cardunculus var. scolymus]|uniref:Uncharacterized protein n=1 Tax=Cynara cardunculus var. scolymus TaxID=59895 RepID=A0A118K178_CYNCS|nr:hypothetical protein Ccrd_019298 [Cynara cardunculus var. scolymus]